MQRQIPDGPENLDCPLHKKAMSKVCKRCPLFIQVRGVDKNTNEEVDSWNCSLAWLPMLLIENAQVSRSGTAATESLRNEIVARADQRTHRLPDFRTNQALLPNG